MTRRERRRLALILALSALVALLLSAIVGNHLLVGPQSAAQDLYFQVWSASGVAEAARSVLIVAIDEKSLAELGLRVSDWPRAYHARLVDQLRAGLARGIVYDVGFIEPHADDAEVARALTRFREVPLEELRQAGLAAVPRTVVLAAVGAPESGRQILAGSPPMYPNLLPPQPAYVEASTILGHVNQIPDQQDGVVRSIPMLIRAAGRDTPSLSLAAVAAFTNRISAPVSADAENGGLRAAGRFIPTTSDSRMLVSYVGPPSNPDRLDRQTFRVVSFVDVMQGRVDPAAIRDRMAFVGFLDAAGLTDAYQVPTSRGLPMAGVEIHANAFATILASRFFYPQPVHATVALVVFTCLVTGLITARYSVVWSAAAALAVLFLYLFGSMVYVSVAYDELGVALPDLVAPPLGLMATFVTTTVARVIFEQAESRATRNALGKYLSPAILDAVMRDPDQLKLGGEKRVMTVLFADIRGFTSFAETIDPDRLVPLLNEYLGIMTTVVHNWDGVLDKYMGDAIMAWWGAPVDQPDHAFRACMAALEMRRQLKLLHQRWEAAGVPLLEMGVGVNTGPMVYGNTGSSERFDFTVLGDAVNLASRLEGANKEYGSNVIISDATLRAAGAERFVVRFLDLIEVQGKSQPAEIHELLDTPHTVSAEVATMVKAWQQAMELYQAREFYYAEQAFRRILANHPDDGPAAVYVERCVALRESPPAEDWDGVFVMTHK